MEIAFQVGGGIVVLFTLIALGFSLKTWKFFHVFAAFLVLASAVAFLAYAAMALKTRSSWVQIHDQQKARIAEQTKELEKLTIGDLSQVNRTELSLAAAREKLWRETHGRSRGRVWSNCSVAAPFDGNQMVVNTQTATAPSAPPADGSAPPPPAAPAPNRIAPKSKLFVVKEGLFANLPPEYQTIFRRDATEMLGGEPPSDDQWQSWVQGDPSLGIPPWKVPFQYLGEFIASDVTATTVTLVPTVPLEPTQLAGLQNLTGYSLALYEKMPTDSHDVFAGLSDQEIKNFFARDRERMGFGKPGAATPEQDEAYQRFIDSFRFDGQPLEEIRAQIAADASRTVKDFIPAPGEEWSLVEFTKPHKIKVDSPLDPDPTKRPHEHDGAQFDTNGQAIASKLRHGEDGEVEFVPSNTPGAEESRTKGLFDPETADELINDLGVAKLVQPVYVRNLRDFEFEFHDVNRQIKHLNDKIASVKVEQGVIADSLAEVVAEKAVRQEEYDKLRLDKDNFEKERDDVVAYHKKLEQEWADMKAEIVALYRQTKQYEEQLTAINTKLTEEIDRRVEEATTETSLIAN